MNKEQILSDFIKEAESILKSKREPILKLSGMERFNAIDKHLDDFNSFVNELNKTINKVLEKHKVVFKSLEESEEFSKFIRPTFDLLYKKYPEGLF